VQWLERFQTWYANLDAGRRLRLSFAIVVAVVAVVALSWWGAQPTWVPILSGRGYDAALTAASSVEEAGIAYRIVLPDQLQVPRENLGAAKAAISADNKVPGLSDVSELQLGLTPQAQSWAFLRAAEGDLARMINNIDGVAASQVHVVPRGESLWVGEERPATASVFVQLERGVDLHEGQVRAIASLVANAVEGLDPDHVSVADDSGNLLAAGTGNKSGDGELASLVDYRTAVEQRYERAVSQAILPVLGYGGGFSVTATVDLDLTARETTSRNIDPDKQAVVSEVTEESKENKSAPSGVPGVDANMPERTPSPGGAGSNSDRTSATTNYSYPTVDEIARKPAGGVQRLSVAVQVDEARIAAIVEASGGTVDAAEIQKRIDAAVRAAVGADVARKDQIEVSFLPFAPAPWTVGTEEPVAVQDVVYDILPYVIAILALLLLFFIVIRPVVTAATTPPPLEPLPLPLEEPVGEAVDEAPPDLAERLKALVDRQQPIDGDELNRLVERESELAADVLRKWSRGS